MLRARPGCIISHRLVLGEARGRAPPDCRDGGRGRRRGRHVAVVIGGASAGPDQQKSGRWSMASALEGIRVIDLAQHMAGPGTSMYLADQGAEVVKIEPPG